MEEEPNTAWLAELLDHIQLSNLFVDRITAESFTCSIVLTL